MPVRRSYLVALGAAILAIAAYVAIPSQSAPSPPHLTSGQEHAMEAAALRRLGLPSSFKPISRGCSIGHCYLVKAPASAMEALMPHLMRSAGMQPLGRLRSAEPLAQLKAAHWSTASSDPLVIACKRISASPSDAPSACQDAARIGPTLVNALIRPSVVCRKQACVDQGLTEVVTWAVAYPTTA